MQYPGSGSFIIRLFSLFAVVVLFAGCAPSTVLTKTDHIAPSQNVSVLLMPIDIELSSLTAGGVEEPRADWTQAANKLVTDAIRIELGGTNDKMIEYVEPEDPASLELHSQLNKLHGVVGTNILLQSVLPAYTPPTKQGTFDWSMGEEVASLRDASGADYGLFVYIRDSYATAGRKALIVTSALLGVSVQGGTQVGFATLVDLDTGNVVWFNRIISNTGDLRTADPAHDAVSQLMDDIPL